MFDKYFAKKISGVSIHAWLLLFAICIVGYWPISTNLFSLKNDAYIYFLPCRYFISESIQSGHLPLWNPYFYMGFPLHGDMQGGVWNPVVLLFSLFGRYNMTTLQFETLLYIFLAGIGMYKLLSISTANHVTKLIVAATYMFCGFIIDTGQITAWTGSAAFIPFIFLYYYRVLFQQENIYKNALKTALALYFLFTAGYPSFVIMDCYVLLISLLVSYISNVRQNGFNKDFTIALVKANALVGISFILISLPALLSYVDYFPYYQRSSGTTLGEAQENPFNPFAVISYLLPLSVTREHPYLSTDLTARSGYIGLFTFLFLFGIFRKKINGLQKFIVATTVFIFLFSMGDALPIRKFCYNYLPLMNLFRHPGTMRLFTTIGLLILSSFYLDELFIALKNKKVKYYTWLSIALIAVVSVIIIAYLKSGTLVQKLTSLKQSPSSSGNLRFFLKDFYDGFSFADAILVEGLLQVSFLLVFIILLKKKMPAKPRLVTALFIFNPLLLAQLSIPSTFVSKQAPSKINGVIALSPKDYPIPDLTASIVKNSAMENVNNRENGFALFYKKKLVQVDEIINPSVNKSLRSFDEATRLSSVVMQYPVCYFADTLAWYKDSSTILTNNKKILFIDDTCSVTTVNNGNSKNDEIVITRFAPWGMFFETNISGSKPFVLFQNYNKNWKLFIDGKNVEIKKGNISFMYAYIEQGRHSLQFYYKPPYILYAILTSLITLILMILFLAFNKKKP